MVVHSNDLCLGGDTVKELLDIIADGSTDVIGKLLCIFKEHDVVKCQVVNRFTFAVRGDVRWKSVCSFQTVGHFVTDPTGQEGLPVMVEGDGSACERVAWFGDRDLSVILCGLWQDTMYKAVEYEALCSMCPGWRDACQHIESETIVSG